MFNRLIQKFTMDHAERGQITNRKQAQTLADAEALKSFADRIADRFQAADENEKDVNQGAKGSVYAEIAWDEPVRGRDACQHHELQGSLKFQEGDLGGDSDFQAAGSRIYQLNGPNPTDGFPTPYSLDITRTVNGQRTEIIVTETAEYEFSSQTTRQWAIFEGDKVSYRCDEW